ncbi:MAG TPA: hypothetical protein VIJ23_13670 [Mycobacterium sp.]
MLVGLAQGAGQGPHLPVGQGGVQGDHVRAQRVGQGAGLLGVIGLADRGKVAFTGRQSQQRPPRQRVGIDHQQPRQCRPGQLFGRRERASAWPVQFQCACGHRRSLPQPDRARHRT